MSINKKINDYKMGKSLNDMQIKVKYGNKVISGISGKATGGKTTLSDTIVSLFNVTNVRVKQYRFAEALKSDLIPILKFKIKDAKESLKSVIDLKLLETGTKKQIKWVNKMLTTYSVVYQNLEEQGLIVNGKFLGQILDPKIKEIIRPIYQVYGAANREIYNKNYWVSRVESQIEEDWNDYDIFIIDDVRYKNELDLFKKYNMSYLIRIDNQVVTITDLSETDLDEYANKKHFDILTPWRSSKKYSKVFNDLVKLLKK